MASCFKEKRFQEGARIIVEGDEGNFFYVVRDGEVKCTARASEEEVCRRLKSGDFFGELALLSKSRRQATVTATATTTVHAR